MQMHGQELPAFNMFAGLHCYLRCPSELACMYPESSVTEETLSESAALVWSGLRSSSGGGGTPGAEAEAEAGQRGHSGSMRGSNVDRMFMYD